MRSLLTKGRCRGVAATAAARVGEWLAAPAPPERLAAFRILVGAFTTTYVAILAPVFLGLADRSRSSFEPVGVLWWLGSPLPDAVVTTAVVGVLASGCAVTVGLFYRVTGPLCAVLALLLTTYRSSWGQLLWFENLLALHLLIVGFARAADAYAVDARRRRHHGAVNTAAIALPISMYALYLPKSAAVGPTGATRSTSTIPRRRSRTKESAANATPNCCSIKMTAAGAYQSVTRRSPDTASRTSLSRGRTRTDASTLANCWKSVCSPVTTSRRRAQCVSMFCFDTGRRADQFVGQRR